MIRKTFFIITTVILVIAVFTGIVSALDVRKTAVVKANLENVRSVATSTQVTGIHYAIDNGELFAGRPGEWRKVATPAGLIAGAVAMDTARRGVVYMGAANEMAVYRSTDGGKGWRRVPLTGESIGGVTSLAVDSVNRIVYAGTDTAGVFRLRDVGSSMIAGGQMKLDTPVLQVAADNTGAGLVFVRTLIDLYRAEHGGLSWSKVEQLGSAPTALAIANRYPATVYVGTADRGVVSSHDGVTWEPANDGMGMLPGTRLYVDALAVDPAQLDVLYAAVSYVNGTTQVHAAPVGVTMSTNVAASWSSLSPNSAERVVELLPVAGQTGAVYALTTTSRTPQAVGQAQLFAEPEVVVSEQPANTAPLNSVIAWMIAGLAGAALLFALISDAARRSKQVATQRQVRPQPVSTTR